MSMITKIKSLETKQKIKLGIFAVILVIVIWEAYGLMSGPSTPATNNSGQPPVIVQQKVETHVQEKQFVPVKITSSAVLQKNQEAYVKALNQLQLLKVQEAIQSTKKSIADSQLATKESEEKMQTLTRPAVMPMAPVSSDAYAKNLVNPVDANTTGAVIDADSYKLLYVASESGVWQAIIGNNGKLYNVELNTALPDGSVVMDITSTKVTLSNHGVRRILSITPTV